MFKKNLYQTAGFSLIQLQVRQNPCLPSNLRLFFWLKLMVGIIGNPREPIHHCRDILWPSQASRPAAEMPFQVQRDPALLDVKISTNLLCQNCQRFPEETGVHTVSICQVFVHAPNLKPQRWRYFCQGMFYWQVTWFAGAPTTGTPLPTYITEEHVEVLCCKTHRCDMMWQCHDFLKWFQD